MTQRPRPSTRRPASTRRWSRWRLVFWAMFVAVVAGGAWWHWGGGPDLADLGLVSDDAEPAAEAGAKSGDRSVVLVFPEWDASGYVTEERLIPSRDRPGEDLLGVMKILCAGPRVSGAVSALPRGTRALAAFVDVEKGAVVLDFSQELVTGHPGGSAAESATLTSILRTVVLNFPDTDSCIILVDGAQVETLAGHLVLDRPFDPRRWL